MPRVRLPAHGRQLYSSAGAEYSISAVAWAPNGKYFAVGSFNMLRLCDKTGWSHSRVVLSTSAEQSAGASSVGSIFHICWTADSTQVAAGSGSGAVLFGQLVQREVSCGALEVRQWEPNSLTVANVLDGDSSREELTFKVRT